MRGRRCKQRGTWVLPAGAIQAPASGLQVGEGATCPEVPVPIASWQLAGDGECHAVTEHTFGSTILFKVKCNSDGSTLVTCADLTNTSTTMQCDNEAYDVNYSILEGLLLHLRSCMANNTRVDYKGWAAKLAPPANQTTVNILMRDGAEAFWVLRRCDEAFCVGATRRFAAGQRGALRLDARQPLSPPDAKRLVA